MPGLICDCCKLPIVPFGGEALCECSIGGCESCRGERRCHGCDEMQDECICDPYGDDEDDFEAAP